MRLLIIPIRLKWRSKVAWVVVNQFDHKDNLLATFSSKQKYNTNYIGTVAIGLFKYFGAVPCY